MFKNPGLQNSGFTHYGNILGYNPKNLASSNK